LTRFVKTPLAVACLVLCAAGGLAACSGGTQRAGSQKALRLTIGDILPLSGQQQPLGAPGEKAANLAVEEIRQAIVKANADHKITIRHVNDRSEPQTALSLAASLVRGGASCLTGPWATNDMIGVANLVSVPKKVLTITPAASSDGLAKLQVGGYVNRTIAPDHLQGDALAQVIETELHGAKGKTVNVGAFRSIYGKGIAGEFGKAWKERGGKVGATVIYESSLPSYQKEAKELVARKADAWVFADFLDTYLKVAVELVRTHKWHADRTFVSDGLAVATLPSNGREITEGVRGVAPSAPETTSDGRAFDKLYKSAPGPKYRQTFDAQNFDAVVLCYLSAVAAGSTKGRSMAQWVRRVSSPPGKQYTWRQLPEAIRALQGGIDIDYQGASGPIDIKPVESENGGNPTAGVYDVFRYRKGLLQIYGQTAVPGKGVVRLKPQVQNPFPVLKVKKGATGATGATGASGASGASGKKNKTKRKR
jgi:ABC-type branched-subunit amino acid transport system substrate-binding protein